jgi:hypothetical protein
MKALKLKAADPRLQKAKAQPFEHQVVCPPVITRFQEAKTLVVLPFIMPPREKTMGWKGRLL